MLIANIGVNTVAQRIVAGVKAWFTLHPTIHDAFRRAIVARNKCTAWYEKNTKGQWKSNQSHACRVQFHSYNNPVVKGLTLDSQTLPTSC